MLNLSKKFCWWDIFGHIYNLKVDLMSRTMLDCNATHVVHIILYSLALKYLYLRSLIFLRALDFDIRHNLFYITITPAIKIAKLDYGCILHFQFSLMLIYFVRYSF